MDRITQLTKIFADYQIYSKQLYLSNTPVRIFQQMYPLNHYSNQMETFLQHHNYTPVRRGTDLPWWGKF